MTAAPAARCLKFLRLLLFFLAAGLPAGCEQAGDCLAQGTCQCRNADDCAEGLDCIDGRCGRLQPPPAPRRRFGEPCRDDSECMSGRCLPRGPGNGGVCTRSCAETPCPDGFECKSDWSRDPAGEPLCVQSIATRLCTSCAADNQCNAIGDLCVLLGEQRVCLLDCARDDCPPGYQCRPVPVPGGQARQCLPAGGSCDCSEDNLGLVRSCRLSNEFGTCTGLQECLPAEPAPAWGPCDAPRPERETCNGRDDDCDGLTDDADSDLDVSTLPADPPYPACRPAGAEACLGRWHCLPLPEGGYGFVCSGVDPQVELCNGRDDDCNGRADDPFTDAAGRYVHLEHCGGCGGDCRQMIDHLRRDADGQVAAGAVACLVRDGRPLCVPLECEPGYYPYPEQEPVLCAPLVSPACQPCSQDDDCRVHSDICARLGPAEPGSFCLQSCQPTAPYFGCQGAVGEQDCCPAGYLCQDFQGGRFCLPENGSCTCSEERQGARRPCLLTGPGGEVCQGEQECQADESGRYFWSECRPAQVVVEVCDYLDNDCDGAVDEDFKDEQGAYSGDRHCAGCNNDCLARWSQDYQHAIGGCRPQLDGFACRIVSCTQESWVAGEQCRSDADCSQPGHYCSPEAHYCRPGDDCPGGDCGLSCTDDQDCRVLGPWHGCRQGFCRLELQFFNVNGLDVDGCECGAPVGQSADEPDVFDFVPAGGEVYLDENCDGIDGNAARALFVSAAAPSGGDGSRERPFTTITEALAAFSPGQHEHILVAAGLYQENVHLVAGVRLYGGYSSDFSDRDVVLNPSVIVGSAPAAGQPPGTVNGSGIKGATTVLSGFTIYGYDVVTQAAAGQPGTSSYAVYLSDCDASLLLANNFIIGGRGGAGGDGALGASGASGADGQPGRDSRQCQSADCFGESQPGGTGGSNAACSQAAGNPGAPARPYCHFADCTQDYRGGRDGRGGSDSIYGSSPDPALCKYDCQVSSESVPSNGQDAGAGSDGTAGGGGTGCQLSAGRVVGGLFQAGGGTAGSAGQNGQGGGGGGAGGAVINYNTSPPCSVGEPLGDLGATGGGGGAGGCGGEGGQGGGGGGGSFGVFIYFSTAPASYPRVRDNRILRGFGGRGGRGGSGGRGGLGGQGGRGGVPVLPAWCAGAAGSGGRGGDGGAGGGGGGGCGGVSFAVASNRVDDPARPFFGDNVFVAPEGGGGGSGGSGGGSPAGEQASGRAGADGASGDWHVY